MSPSETSTSRFGNDEWRLFSLPSGLADVRIAVSHIRSHIGRLRDWKPDIIHVHTPGPIGLLGTAAAMELDVPLVHTYHTDIHSYADHYMIPTVVLGIGLLYIKRTLREPVSTSGVLQWNRHRLITEANRVLMARAVAIVVPTRAPLERFPLPVPASRIHIIRTSLSAQLPVLRANDRDDFRQGIGIGAASFVALSVGRISSEKGVDLLLAAFREVGRRHPDATLLLVGHVSNVRALRRSMRQAGVDQWRVVVAGVLSQQALLRAYHASDVFVFASQTDTQGIVLDEAAQMGLPIVMVDDALHRHHPARSAIRLCRPDALSFAEGILKQASLVSPTTSSECEPPRSTAADFANSLIGIYAEAVNEPPEAVEVSRRTDG